MSIGKEFNRSFEWFKVAGLKPEDTLTQISVAASEYKEHLEAVHTGDVKLRWDAYADRMVTIAGLMVHATPEQYDRWMYEWDNTYSEAESWSISAKAVRLALKAVNDSNYTKFAETLDEAAETQDLYRDLGVATNVQKPGDVYVIHSAKDQRDLNGKFYEENKILKSVNFVEPDFSEAIKEMKNAQ